jgi:D-xylonolactonase
MISSVAVAAQTNCLLGEGLVWDSRYQLMRLVDIHGRRIHAFSPDDGLCQSWQADERIGWLIPTPTAWVGGFQSGIALFSFGDNGQINISEWISRPFDGRPFMRLNDGKCDTTGNIWTGSLNNDAEIQPDGAFYRLAPDGTLTVVDDGYCVTNGPALSPDGRTMLHTDSVKRTIYAFDVDPTTAQIAGKRVWKVLDDAEGHPDGMTFDRDGCLWLAHWGAGCVSRYSASGLLMKRVSIPALNVTNVAFGGPNLDRLFVTSARVGLTDAQLSAYPSSGCVFEIHEHGTQGYETPVYRG